MHPSWDISRVFSAGIDNAETGFSQIAADVTQVLRDAGLEVQQRPYVLADNGGFYGSGARVRDRIKVAVLVHRRDQARANEVLHGSEHLSAPRTTP